MSRRLSNPKRSALKSQTENIVEKILLRRSIVVAMLKFEDCRYGVDRINAQHLIAKYVSVRPDLTRA